MQFRGPACLRRGGREIPAFERCKKWRRSGLRPFGEVAQIKTIGRIGQDDRIRRLQASSRHALVVAPQFVDRELPSRALMLDHTLHDGERARREAWPQILDRISERRRPRESTLAKKRAHFEFGIDPRLEAPEYLQHQLIAEKR